MNDIVIRFRTNKDMRDSFKEYSDLMKDEYGSKSECFEKVFMAGLESLIDVYYSKEHSVNKIIDSIEKDGLKDLMEEEAFQELIKNSERCKDIAKSLVMVQSRLL